MPYEQPIDREEILAALTADGPKLKANALSEEFEHYIEFMVAKEVRETFAGTHIIAQQRAQAERASRDIITSVTEEMLHKNPGIREEIAERIAALFIDRSTSSQRFMEEIKSKIGVQMMDAARRAIEKAIAAEVDKGLAAQRPRISEIGEMVMKELSRESKEHLLKQVGLYPDQVDDLRKRVTIQEQEIQFLRQRLHLAP